MILDVNKIKLLGCGRKHYIIVTEDNQLAVWGSVFKEKVDIDLQSEGFSLYDGDKLFEGHALEALEVKYGIFGAVVQDK